MSTRKEFIDQQVDVGAGVDSLVGSWFHRLEDDEVVWLGLVVAEPKAGTYLVEIESENLTGVQKLVTIEKMVKDEDGDWHFFDTETRARCAYAEWLVGERAA